MAPARRRLLVPLALSLAGHALLCLAIGLVPGPRPSAPAGSHENCPLTLRMGSMSGPVRRAPKPVEPDEDWVAVVVGPATTPACMDPSLAPKLGPPTVGETGGVSGAGSRPAGSSVVVVPAETRRVVFLLDRSVSMGLADGLDRAKVELAAALTALPPETSFQVLVYNSSAWPLVSASSGLLPACRDNVERVLHQLEALAASGITRHVEAVRAALAFQPDLLILLTDADDLSAGDVRLMTTANHGRATIDIVELTRDPRPRPESSLASLAAQNQGRHRRVLLGR